MGDINKVMIAAVKTMADAGKITSERQLLMDNTPMNGVTHNTDMDMNNTHQKIM